MVSVAFNRVDITPSEANGGNLYMSGYGWSPRSNRHYVVHPQRPLRAECAVIKGSGSPLIMLRVDVVSVPSFVYRALRDHVVNSGITNAASFMLVSSHTHSGPVLPQEPDPYSQFGLTGVSLEWVNAYANWLVQKLIDLINRTAGAAGTPVTLKYAEGEALDIAVNRCGLGWLLNLVPVLVAYREGTETPALVLFGFGSHPVTRGTQPVYDADYPAVAAQVIEQALGCPAMFFLGFAGDQDPNRTDGNDATVDIGTRVGNAALAAISNSRPVTGSVTTDLRRSQLPLAVNIADPAIRSGLIQRYAADREEAQQAGDLPVARFCESMQAELTNGTSPAAVSLPVQCWKFGTDFAILALGGEILSGYHFGLRSFVQPRGLRLWTMAYANEVPCYVPADDILWHQAPKPDYESGWNGTDPKITGHYTSMMAYGWPVPLAASPQPTPTQPGSAEYELMKTCKEILA